tara:strand:+ start:965 stop:1117 length:153 start_codon:yes stop_codon:yes gene_type:complete
MLNRTFSVTSEEALVIGIEYERLRGPIGVNQSSAKPAADLILLSLSKDEL